MNHNIPGEIEKENESHTHEIQIKSRTYRNETRASVIEETAECSFAVTENVKNLRR